MSNPTPNSDIILTTTGQHPPPSRMHARLPPFNPIRPRLLPDVDADIRHARSLLLTAFSGPTLASIAHGSTATVYHIPGTDRVVKESLDRDQNGSRGVSHGLWTEMVVHKRVQRAFRDANFTAVHVPRFLQYIGCDDRWDLNDARAAMVFPHRDRAVRALSVMERVPCVPVAVRRAMIQVFFDDDLQKTILDSREREQCLVQVMMGKRREHRQDWSVTALHGYELCVNQIKDLGVDVRVIVRAMGQALAILHWVARVDGKGVKFVLGAPPKEEHYDVFMPRDEQGMNRKNRAVHLWMMGFNKANLIPDNGRFHDMAVAGFLENKEFWPRPAVGNAPMTQDEVLNWEEFCKAYMRTTVRINDENEMRAINFIDMIEDHFGAGRSMDGYYSDDGYISDEGWNDEL